MPEVVFGRPFRGYVDSIARQEVGLNETTSEAGDAANWELLPGERGRWRRRAGMLNEIVGLTEAGIVYNGAGVAYEFKGVQVAEHRANSLGVNQPVTWVAFITQEEHASNSKAQLCYYDRAAGLMRRVAYDANNAAWPNANTIVWPWIGGNRMNASDDRLRQASGSRNFLDLGDHIHFGAYGSDAARDGIPNGWNKKYPNSSIALERTERVLPTGMCPPMWIPRVSVPAATALGNESWHDSDLFYLSVLFIYKDGSWGPPCPVRAPNPNLSAAGYINGVSPVLVYGYGLVRLAATVGATAFPYIELDDIPTGPGGINDLVAARVIVQSPKVAGPAAAAAAVNMPDPRDLRIRHIIWDNTTTSIRLADGTDAGLETATKIRFDHPWQPPARYLGQMEGRIVASYVRDHPCGIMICFRTNSVASDVGGGGYGTVSLHNTPDDGVDTVRLAYVNISGAPPILNLYVNNVVDQTHHRQYALTGFTLQELVDRINSQRQVAVADTNIDYRWHAQLVPGANGDQAATNLSSASTNTFADVGGTWVTAAPAVVDGAATRAAGLALSPVRSLACSWPAMLKLGLSGRPENFPNLSYFTSANPGGPKNAANLYLLGDPVLGSFNVRRNPGNAGDCAGPWLPLTRGAIVPCTRAVCRCFNTRDTDTGIDDDFRLEVIDSERGVISPSCAVGHGFAVVLTSQGLYAYDETVSEGGRGGINLTQKLYNPSDKKGSLAYEITQCIAATALNNSSGYFSVAIAENKIRISFRSSAAVTRPDVWMDLDFSPGIDQHGINALIDPKTGEPWGWGNPFKPADLIGEDGVNVTIAPSAMGVVRNPDGTVTWYGIRDKHDATGAGTTDLRMDTLDTGLTDNGSSIVATLYTPTLYEERRHVHGKRVFTRYKKNGAGLTVAYARSKDAHANPTYFNTAKALPSTGTQVYGRYWWQLPIAKRQASDSAEIQWQDDGTGPQPEIWDGALEFDSVDIGT